MTWRTDWDAVPFDEDAMLAHAEDLQRAGTIRNAPAYVTCIRDLHAVLASLGAARQAIKRFGGGR